MVTGLVDYDTSSESDTAASKPPLKKVRKTDTKQTQQEKRNQSLPALPPSFRDLYATNARVSDQDDPSLHGGRKRITPHVEGNWPTHVYLEWCPSPTEMSVLDRLVQSTESSLLKQSEAVDEGLKTQTLLRSDLNIPLPLHISLSSPLVLRTEQRDDFLDSLVHRIRNVAKPLNSDPEKSDPLFQGFSIIFDGLDWTPNAEGTRWFLALRINRPEGNQLNKLLYSCNQVADLFGLPRLYGKPSVTDRYQCSDPHMRNDTAVGGSGKRIQINEADAATGEEEDFTDCFHFSIAWTLDPPIPQSETGRPAQVERQIWDEVKKLRVWFTEVKVKIGNSVSSMPFANQNEENKGILG